MRRKTPVDQRVTCGATQGPEAGGGRAPWTRGWGPPLPPGTASAPSDTYKIPFTLKTMRRQLFFREVTPTRRHLKS